MDTAIPYCKAFTEAELAAFPGFAAAKTGDSPAASSDTLFYLHDDLRVRAGIFRDDSVVFETTDPAWARFCTENLVFSPYRIDDKH